jgi:putative sterol carrier protein
VVTIDQEGVVADKYPFLSDEWVSAVEGIMAQHADSAGGAPHGNVVVNLVVTDTPFGEDKTMHMGNVDGKALMGGGHREGADVTMTTDYATAKEVFVANNPQAGMQAFMAGKVKVQGDMTKLMMSQGQGTGNPALQTAVQDITE